MSLNKPNYNMLGKDIHDLIDGHTSQLAAIVTNVKVFGAKGDGVTDDTSAIQNALTNAISNGKKLYFPSGTYLVGSNVTTFTWNVGIFSTLTNVDGFTILGNNAYILDGRNMTNLGSNYCPVFCFDTCKNIQIKGLNYKCNDLSYDLTTKMGYWGASYVMFLNDCQNIELDYYTYNARYGVKTGNYTFPQYNGLNGVVNLQAKIKAYYTGYPVAIEMGRHLNIDIEADTMHRACYLSGCDNFKVVVNAKTQYIANAYVILNYSQYIVNGTTYYKGCSNGDVKCSDLGSSTVANDLSLFDIQLYNTTGRTQSVKFHDLRFHGVVPSATTGQIQCLRVDFTSSLADEIDNVEVSYANMTNVSTAVHFRITTDDTKIIRNFVLNKVLATSGANHFLVGQNCQIDIRNTVFSELYYDNGSKGKIHIYDSNITDIRAINSTDTVGELCLDNVIYTTIGNAASFSKLLDTKKFELKYGTTAQRPVGSLRNGMTYYDTDISKFIVRTTNGWIDVVTGSVV